MCGFLECSAWIRTHLELLLVLQPLRLAQLPWVAQFSKFYLEPRALLLRALQQPHINLCWIRLPTILNPPKGYGLSDERREQWWRTTSPSPFPHSKVQRTAWTGWIPKDLNLNSQNSQGLWTQMEKTVHAYLPWPLTEIWHFLSSRRLATHHLILVKMRYQNYSPSPWSCCKSQNVIYTHHYCKITLMSRPASSSYHSVS